MMDPANGAMAGADPAPSPSRIQETEIPTLLLTAAEQHDGRVAALADASYVESDPVDEGAGRRCAQPARHAVGGVALATNAGGAGEASSPSRVIHEADVPMRDATEQFDGRVAALADAAYIKSDPVDEAVLAAIQDPQALQRVCSMLDEPTLRRACDAMAQELAVRGRAQAAAEPEPPSAAANPSPQSIFRPTPSDSMT